MLKSFTYAAEESGPKLLIFGAVHGNEICGTEAIKRVMRDLDDSSLKLIRGQVTFVPTSNPRAYAAGQRFIERNLNRYFVPSEKPVTYEDKLTNILAPLIASADYFIDLHSTTAGGSSFASVRGDSDAENDLAASLGAEMLVYGWPAAYAASEKKDADPNESIGTTAYARQHGAKAVLLECGQHHDPQSVVIAEKSIRVALSHIGLTARTPSAPPRKPQFIRVEQVVYRCEGGSFAEDWHNFSPVISGTIIAQHANGANEMAPCDGVIILPNRNAPANAEWYYFGAKV